MSHVESKAYNTLFELERISKPEDYRSSAANSYPRETNSKAEGLKDFNRFQREEN